MKIAEISLQDESHFDGLARSHGSIFNTVQWTDIFRGKIQRHGIYDKGGGLIGGFVLYKESMFGLSVYRDPPFTPAIGPFLRMDAENPVSVMDTWKEAVSAMAGFVDSLPYALVSLSLNPSLSDVQPFLWKKFKVSPCYTYIIDLTMPDGEIWKRMSNERRKNINKGRSDGLAVREIADYRIIRPLLLETFSRQGKTIDETLLDRILLEFANGDNSFAYGTYDGDRIMACSFCIHDAKTAYYLLGGHGSEGAHNGAGTMAMWESILHAKHIGLSGFDFEGSMISGIERYFRGFGGRLAPYYRINKAMLPLEIILKFFKRELF